MHTKIISVCISSHFCKKHHFKEIVKKNNNLTKELHFVHFFILKMALSFIASSILPIAAIIAGELFILPSKVPQFYESSKIDFLPKGFSLVILINVVVSAYIMVHLGFLVSAARTSLKAKALKDGDKDAEERYSYPKLYAEGFSVHAKQFNCVQRGHQQALETYTAYVALSLIGGIRFPVTVTLAGKLCCYITSTKSTNKFLLHRSVVVCCSSELGVWLCDG
jgi:glutathione S-transferase